jgi:hypothetical protein
VTDNPDMTDVSACSAESGLPPRLRLSVTTCDPTRLAQQILRAVSPGFADAAGVFVLEQLISDSGLTPPLPGARLVMRRLAAGSADDRLPRTDLPPGQVIAFAADTPLGRCVHDGIPVVFTQPGATMLEQISAEARVALAGYEWFVAAPMITRGVTVGVLVMARSTGAPAFNAADVRSPGGACPQRAATLAATGTTSSPCPAEGPDWWSAMSWATGPWPQLS